MRRLILPELVYKFKAITINFPHGALKELYIHTLYFTWRQGTERIPSEVLWSFPGSARWPLGTGQEGWEHCEVSEPHQIRWGALCKLDQGTGRREVSRGTRTGRGGDWQGLPTAENTLWLRKLQVELPSIERQPEPWSPDPQSHWRGRLDPLSKDVKPVVNWIKLKVREHKKASHKLENYSQYIHLTKTLLQQIEGGSGELLQVNNEK